MLLDERTPMKILLKTTFAALCLTGLAVSSVHGSLSPITEEAFSTMGGTKTIVNFDGYLGTAINGLTIKGFTFSENYPNAIVASDPPYATSHISPPAASFVFPTAGYILTIDMPTVVTSFGFGFALSDLGSPPNALTIKLFNGATDLGSLPYGGTSDPFFAGGFAGIGSPVGFTKAEITFGPSVWAYAIDNIAAVAPVPESSTCLAGALLTIPVGFRCIRFLRNRQQA
jgi:hypothetical protein